MQICTLSSSDGALKRAGYITTDTGTDLCSELGGDEQMMCALVWQVLAPLCWG